MTRENAEFWIPTTAEVQEEMQRVKKQDRFSRTLWSTLGTVIVVVAVAIVIASIFLPVLRVTGTSMVPNFEPGDVLVAFKTNRFKTGDICTFYYNNKLIIKRVIAQGGDTVDISEDGRVSVNGKTLEEPYVRNFALGLSDVEFPYTVPSGHLFLLGDNRATSVDSRSVDFGCINAEEVLGKVFLRTWPIDSFRFFGL